MRVRLAAVSKTYRARAGPHVALHDFSLDVADGEALAVVGPSGCGKTTLLRVVAGLEMPDAGAVYFDERDVRALPPERRTTAMVFQRSALFPHLTAFGNARFGSASETPARAALERARVDEGLWTRKPRELSGGEAQRVALARALASEPRVLLLDEPLSNLDAQLRAELRVELTALQRASGATTLFVTHDQTEALAFGRRVAVMRDGHVEQVGSGREIYDEPCNTFVARFIGSPAMSLLEGRIAGGWFDTRGLRVSLDAADRAIATLGVRPNAVRIAPEAEIRGVVAALEDLGGDAFAYVEGAFGRLTVRCDAVRLPKIGESVGIAVDATQAHLFDANGARVPAAVRA